MWRNLMEIKKLEKFAIVIIILWLITLLVSPLLFDVVLLSLLDLEVFGSLSARENLINVALMFLRNIVELAIGLWLFFQTRSAKWIWLMLGIIFGINAAILYYLIQYIDLQKSEKEAVV